MRLAGKLLSIFLVLVPVVVMAQSPEWSPHRGGIVPPGSPWMTTAPAHRVIRSPHDTMSPDETGLGRHLAEQYADTHPPHTSHRRRVLPAPATIPAAMEQPRWKAPYSYGYFGAKPKPSWTKHHGYRDNFTQWTRQ